MLAGYIVLARPHPAPCMPPYKYHTVPRNPLYLSPWAASES